MSSGRGIITLSLMLALSTQHAAGFTPPALRNVRQTPSFITLAPAPRAPPLRMDAEGANFLEGLLFGRRGRPKEGKEKDEGSEEVVTKPKSRYVPPEEWVDTKTDRELAWERRVKNDAQREGNPMAMEENLKQAIKLN